MTDAASAFTPSVVPKPVRTSDKATDLLRFDLENEAETIRNYRLDEDPPEIED